jgi:hypothetical protein
MLHKIVKAVILERIRLERNETFRWVLDFDVLLDEVRRILSALDELLHLKLLALS